MFAPLFALPNGLKGADNEVVHVRPPCQRVAPDRRGFPRVWAAYLVKGSIKGSIKGGVKSIKGSHQSIKSHRSIKGGVKSINQITSITSNHIHHTKSITFIHQTHQTTSITSNPSHSSIKPHPSHPSTQSHPITPIPTHTHPSIHQHSTYPPRLHDLFKRQAAHFGLAMLVLFCFDGDFFHHSNTFLQLHHVLKQLQGIDSGGRRTR